MNYGWSPYNYCGNNPIIKTDGNGNLAFLLPAAGAGVYVGGAVVIATIGWIYTETTKPGSTKDFIKAVSHSVNQATEDVKDVINNLTGSDKIEGDGTKTKDEENTNPYKGPVSKPVNVVDDKGNVIPVKEGEQIQGSKDGKFQQVKDKNGKPTGVRKDGSHGPNHDPQGQKPHVHRPDIPGTKHWLDIKP